MKKTNTLLLALLVIGMLVVASTGVDLRVSQAGFGLLILGGAGVLLFGLSLIRPALTAPSWLPILTFLGGGYFIARAMIGGPVGLALPDATLVLIFLVTYLAVCFAKPKGLGGIIICLGLLCAVHVGVAVAQEISGNSFYVWRDNPDQLGKTSGLFGHYNPFASFLNGSIFFLLSYVFLGKKSFLRALGLILAVGMAVILVLSESRGGWVSFIAGGAAWLVLLVIYLKQQKSRMVGVAAIVSGILVVGGVVSSFWVIQKITDKRVEEVNVLTGRKSQSRIQDGGRLAMQQMAFEIFQDSPAIGMGPRSFSYLSLEKWDPATIWLGSGVPGWAHNEYLQTLSDYGLVGLAIIVILLLAHGIRGFWSAATSDAEDRSLSMWQIGAIGGLVAVLTQCFFSFVIHVPACIFLVALQVGILASGSRARSSSKTAGRFASLLGVAAALLLLSAGYLYSKTFLLSQKAKRQISSIVTEDDGFRALQTMKDAGDFSRDPRIFEVMGREAMKFATRAQRAGDADLSRKFYLKAKEAFEKSLEYNPHFAPGLAGLPRVNDALGNPDEAEAGYQKAMEKIWSREWQLRPHFFAAQSSYIAALRAHQENDLEQALAHFRTAQKRVQRRLEILEEFREQPDTKKMREEIEGWIAFLEARLLFRKGDDIWINGRPRNPELAYALMLAAQKRYQVSENVVREKDPRWEKQSKQLQMNLGIFESIKQRAAKLTEEEIGTIISAEAGLDSAPATR